MSSDAPAVTQKLLVSAGGWPTMKSAQELHRAGRVADAEYLPPLLTGTVRDGPRSFRSGLRIKSASHIENLCTCRPSREWGTVCAHALAVGLAWLERAAAAPATTHPHHSSLAPDPPKGRAAAPAAKSPAPKFVEIGTAEGAATPVKLHFILPPQFDSAWDKGMINVVAEAAVNGQRTMLGALSAQSAYACDTFDLAALDGIAQSGAGAAAEARLSSMRLFSREEFLRFLPSLRGHPRVTFGKSVPVKISHSRHRPKVRLKRSGGSDGITLQFVPRAGERWLVAGSGAWAKTGSGFAACEEGLPTEFLALADGPLVLRGERAWRFLALEAPRLGLWFDVETDPDVTLPEVRKAAPEFKLEIEGSLRELRALLNCRYAASGRELPPATNLSSSSEPASFSDPKELGVLRLRDTEAELAAVRRLESFGFARTAAAGRFALRAENAVARFFAFGFPRLKAEGWELRLSTQAENLGRELQPLAPAVEIVSSGEHWFEMRYSLSTPNGETLPPAELQRLLRSGQNQTRLRNGRAAVFDAGALAEFEEVLRDCEPVQDRPGVYRIAGAHAGYVAATARETGARVTDLRGALEKFASGGDPNNGSLKGQLGALRNVRLREYQAEGAAWLWRLAESGIGGILADEMGLGKTVQALAFLAVRRAAAPAPPALIVCPSSLVTNWQNEARRFTPELQTLVLAGPERHARFAEIAGADVVITSYALLQRDAERYATISFSTAILDEAQHIKNPDTQNARAAFALRAQHRFVLTGTPIENSVRDLWSLMRFALPGYLGSRADFRERYETPLARGGVGATDVQRRLHRRMRPFLLRRKKSDVAKELPEKIEQVVRCDLSPAQRAAYDGLLREIQFGIGGEKDSAAATRMKMLLGLLRLRQVCCDLRLLGGSGGDNTASKMGESSAKLELLDELLEEAIDGGHRVLVFSQFVSMLAFMRQGLESRSIRFAYLDGQTTERQAVVDRFQSDEGIPVFLMSLKAGGVGLNLSAADTVIHFDPWWNHAVEAQATDRAHRIGQTRVVTAYKLIARDTVEEKIVKLQARKRAASEETIGSEEPLMSGLTTEDLEELLR